MCDLNEIENDIILCCIVFFWRVREELFNINYVDMMDIMNGAQLVNYLFGKDLFKLANNLWKSLGPEEKKATCSQPVRENVKL